MTEAKKIMINPSFFNTTSNGGNKTKKNKGSGRPKKEKPKPVLKPNSMKKTLLEKIKKHQQNEKMSKQHVDESESSNKQNDGAKFTDDFMNSMEYLSKLGGKNKKMNQEKKKHNKTQKIPHLGGNGPATPPTMILPTDVKISELVSITLPNDFDTSLPVTNNQHGDQYIQTNYPEYTNNIPINMGTTSQVSIHNNIAQPSHPQPSHPQPSHPQPSHPQQPHVIVQEMQQPIPLVGGNADTPYGCLKGGKKPTYRQYHNKTMKNTYTPVIDHNVPKHVTDRQHQLAKLKKSYKKFRQKKRTTKKSTYTLGKRGNNVSILIKNNATRRKIRKEHGLLKQKPITEVKKYLYDKNLLKIGSTAPNDVLRTMFEQSILAGNVTNISNDIQFHNFMNTT